MNTNIDTTHPLAHVAFLNRRVPVTSGIGCNVPSRPKASITTVRTSGAVYEKANGRDNRFVRVS
jgi:hypothetical protein